jgi:hypothetical protein
MYDYSNIEIDELKQLKDLYTANVNEIYRLQQTNKYLKRNILDVMHTKLRMPFVFSDNVFRKAQKNDKKYYDVILDLLQEYISKDIDKYEVIMCGYDDHGAELRFTLDDTDYQLYVPICRNISESSAISGDYIDYDIVNYRIFKRTSKCSWSSICCSDNIEDIKKALDNDREGVV